MDHVTETAVSPFGARLRRWRTHRGLSQLALAAAVGSTARHLSFLATGRSRPSRQMVLRLGEVLDVPLTHRFLADPAAPQAIANWPEVAWAGLDRLRHQLDRTPADHQLAKLVELAETALSGVPRPHQPFTDPVICPWFRIGDQVVKTIGIAARFESAAEITLDELRIELTYPLDAEADHVLRSLLPEPDRTPPANPPNSAAPHGPPRHRR